MLGTVGVDSGDGVFLKRARWMVVLIFKVVFVLNLTHFPMPWLTILQQSTAWQRTSHLLAYILTTLGLYLYPNHNLFLPAPQPLVNLHPRISQPAPYLIQEAPGRARGRCHHDYHLYWPAPPQPGLYRGPGRHLPSACRHLFHCCKLNLVKRL